MRYEDGRLRFSQLQLSHSEISGSTACEGVLTCTYTDTGIATGQCRWPTGSGAATEGPGQPFTTSFGLFQGTGADLAADGGVGMEMENAAAAFLPRSSSASSRVTSWNGSVVLDYAGR